MNRLLFDISPEEPEKTKKKQKRAAKTPPPEHDPGPMPPAATDGGPIPANVGVVAPGPVCERCGATSYWDVLRDTGKIKELGCGFCCHHQVVKSADYAVLHSGEFVFLSGRYPGMTVAQVLKQAGGIDYIRWASENHKDIATRTACKEALCSS